MAALAERTVLLRVTPTRCPACRGEVLVAELPSGEPVQLEVDELDGHEPVRPRFVVDEGGRAYQLGEGGLGRQRREGDALHAPHRCKTLRGRS